jgi:aminoglycoside 6'-N-acetyltransferase
VKLREHNVTLRGKTVVLRPMTEGDWDILLKWNSDPEVLYFCEGDDVASYSVEMVQRMYRGVSQSAFCFIVEVDGSSVGECWLQRMNLARILEKHPGKDCRRIDLMIGEKELWGRGLGTDVIHTLTKFGFEGENASLIFGCDIADDNPRSLRAFQRVGYEIDARIREPSGGKARYVYDVVMPREKWRSTE